MWDLKDILNSRKNRSENKLVRENAVEVARSRLWLLVQIKMRYYMDRGVIQPKRVISPTGVPHLPVKDALVLPTFWNKVY